ncbi:MAG: hypothetical protein K8R65_01625 [Nitrospirae bacterium]|nr:hypothetical protein [Nitrospirota bacterium]
MSFAERMLKIDRRIIFLVIGLCTLLPLLYPVGLPIKISPEVRGVYDYIESLPDGSVFLLSLDFDPASKPELHPQSISLLRHAFRKNLRVIAMTLWVSGTGMADQVVTQVAREMGKESGKDYVFLGWSPGGTAVIINMGQDLYGAFPADYNGKPTKGMPVLQGIANLRDVGLRGAAEYETLIGQKGKAIAGMDAQSATHLAIIVLVMICNLFYFSMRRQAKQQGHSGV